MTPEGLSFEVFGTGAEGNGTAVAQLRFASG